MAKDQTKILGKYINIIDKIFFIFNYFSLPISLKEYMHMSAYGDQNSEPDYMYWGYRHL